MAQRTAAPSICPADRRMMSSPESQPDPWAEVKRLTSLAKKTTFVVGDVWLSPGCHHFEVVHVSPEGVATMHKLGPGWERTVNIRWNSPKLFRWSLLTR